MRRLRRLDGDRDFLKKGNVFDDDQIDAYIDLKMEDVETPSASSAPGRIRHVLFGLIGRAVTQSKRRLRAALFCWPSLAAPRRR